MTLVVALVWGRGILVSADSRASTGFVYHEERKVYPIYIVHDDKEYDLAIVAGAGDVALVKQGFHVIERVFREWFFHVGLKEGRNPRASEVGEIVGEIERRLIQRYCELRNVGIEPSIQLLLAIVTQEGKPLLYIFDSRGIAEPVHDNPGYALLGSGTITGGLLLLRLLDYHPGEAWEWDLGLLSAFIIDMVSEVDPSVSPFLGESFYIRYDEKEGKVVLGPLKIEVYKEYKDRVRKRRELLRYIWNLAEKLGEKSEETIIEKLNMLEKEAK